MGEICEIKMGDSLVDTAYIDYLGQSFSKDGSFFCNKVSRRVEMESGGVQVFCVREAMKEGAPLLSAGLCV